MNMMNDIKNDVKKTLRIAFTQPEHPVFNPQIFVNKDLQKNVQQNRVTITKHRGYVMSRKSITDAPTRPKHTQNTK